MRFGAIFSFKWNGAFWVKRRRFMHYSLKKSQTVPFWTAPCVFFFPWTRRGRGRRRFSPLQHHYLPPHLHKTWYSPRPSFATMMKIRQRSPVGGWGNCTETPQPPYPVSRIGHRQGSSSLFLPINTREESRTEEGGRRKKQGADREK